MKKSTPEAFETIPPVEPFLVNQAEVSNPFLNSLELVTTTNSNGTRIETMDAINGTFESVEEA